MSIFNIRIVLINNVYIYSSIVQFLLPSHFKLFLLNAAKMKHDLFSRRESRISLHTLTMQRVIDKYSS